MKIWFHIKWFFKKRYSYYVGTDPAIKGETNSVVMKYDRKYEKYTVIK